MNRIDLRNPEKKSVFSLWHRNDKNMPTWCSLMDIDGYIRNYKQGITHLIEDRTPWNESTEKNNWSFEKVLKPMCAKHGISLLHNVAPWGMQKLYYAAGYKTGSRQAEYINVPSEGRIRESAEVLWIPYISGDPFGFPVGLYVTRRNYRICDNVHLDWFIPEDIDAIKQLAARLKLPFLDFEVDEKGQPSAAIRNQLVRLYER